MAIYHVKRDGKLYGPLAADQVAKCINTDIFTSKDLISEDLITWDTVEIFKRKWNIIKPISPTATAYASPLMPEQNMHPPIYSGNGKSRRTYIMLAVLLGAFGVHNFYSGHTLQGVIKLLLALSCVGLWVSWIWALCEAHCNTADASGTEFSWYPTNKGIYLLLCILFGTNGLHFFYAGYTGKGIVQYILSTVLLGVPQIIYSFAILNQESGLPTRTGPFMLIWMLAALAYWITVIIIGCCVKVDAYNEEIA